MPKTYLLFQAGFMPFIQNTIAEVLVGFYLLEQ